MISATLRIELPTDLWVTAISTAHPRATLRLLSGYRSGETALELGETVADDPGPIVEAIRTHPAIREFEVLESDGRRTLARYETLDTALYDFVEMVDSTIEFPVVVTNGHYEFEVTGTRPDLDRIHTVLEESPLSYELQSIVTSADPDSVLTDRQREVLRTAHREGYFRVPRDCSLAELAEILEVDKSTASTVLRRGEARLVDWFLTRPDRPSLP